MSLKNSRARVVAGTAAVLAVGLILTGCSKSTSGASGATTSGSSGAGTSKTCIDSSGSSIKIGFLNSLSGTMAISEKTVSDSLHMAADEINAAGGIAGKQLDVIQEDGASDPTTFADKA